ncbi:MAG: hypothetical protein WD768_17805 [Phycisphaeraceae bacterium]
MSTKPWRNWYHCMSNTYGTWLDGDGRGFRTRHHREHVEGDYKHPPAKGKYDARFHAAKSSMKRDAVLLSMDVRKIVCLEMGLKLLEKKVELIEMCVTEKHFHALARFTPWVEEASSESPGIAIPGLSSEAPKLPAMIPPPRVSKRHGPLRKRPVQIDPAPRQLIGIAKKHSSHILRSQGILFPGGVWATRCKVEPVHDRPHQVNTCKYIREHIEEGGVLFSTLYAEWFTLQEAVKAQG